MSKDIPAFLSHILACQRGARGTRCAVAPGVRREGRLASELSVHCIASVILREVTSRAGPASFSKFSRVSASSGERVSPIDSVPQMRPNSTARASDLNEYLKHLKTHAQHCLTIEPGTLEVRDTRATGGGGHGYLYEVYASPEAFEAHWNGPSKQQAERDFKGLKVSGVACVVVSSNENNPQRGQSCFSHADGNDTWKVRGGNYDTASKHRRRHDPRGADRGGDRGDHFTSSPPSPYGVAIASARRQTSGSTCFWGGPMWGG
jgi:quinol monooxygenase YgiN